MNRAASDAELAAAAARGAAPAFAIIVSRHQGALRGFLRRLCGNWADADDLAQETFVAAWTHLRTYRAAASLRTWLCGIGYRKYLSQRRQRGSAALREAAFTECADMGERPGADDLMDLAKAMAGLPVDQRAALALCLAQGFSHGEAAEVLGLPLGTVKSHVLRGRQKLLEALTDERP